MEQQVLKEIDSLIHFNQRTKAYNLIDSLLVIYPKESDFVWELKYFKGLIIDNEFDHTNALPILIEVLTEAEKRKLYHLICRTQIRIAFNQEKAHNYHIAYAYLNKANKLCEQHQLYDLQSSIYIRYALLHRFLGNDMHVLSNIEIIKKELNLDHFTTDSAFYYCYKAIDYAQKYNQTYDLNEAYTTLGILESEVNKSYLKSIEYYQKTIPYWKEVNNEEYVGLMFLNISTNYWKNKQYEKALTFSDSSYLYMPFASVYYKWNFPRIRSRCFEYLEVWDSAFYYIKIANEWQIEMLQKEEMVKTKNLEEQYEIARKKTIYENKNKQFLLLLCLLGVIVITSIMLLMQNRKIRKSNKIIQKQVDELSKMVAQKQVLLSELQHRVKNNLQHVISVLEIQKESVNFNNIDELIRSNQNRIHSMALLHKKLNTSNIINEIDVSKYVSELAFLVKNSYLTSHKEIELEVQSDAVNMSIEKALPLGIIVTELVSNSMKHAFTLQEKGAIAIHLKKHPNSYTLYYKDDGMGYDFYKETKKGIGQEIIKGLIDQLNGSFDARIDNGFSLSIDFDEYEKQ